MNPSFRQAVLLFLLLVPMLGLRVGPRGPSTLLVADKTGDRVFFLNANTYAVEDTVAVGRGPHEIAVHTELGRAYVANYEGPGTISMLDLETRAEVKRIDLAPYRRPHGIAVRGGSVYVTVEANQAVLEIDARSGAVKRALNTGQKGTHMLAIGADARRLYTTNLASGSVSRLDLIEGRVARHVETGAGTEGIALTPDGSELWVSNRAEDIVTILDTETLETRQTIDVSGFPLRVYLTHDGRRALVSCARAGEVAVVDVESREVLGRISVGTTPIGIQITPDDRRAFVGNMRSGQVTILDLETRSVLRQIRLGTAPDGMALF